MTDSNNLKSFAIPMSILLAGLIIAGAVVFANISGDESDMPVNNNQGNTENNNQGDNNNQVNSNSGTKEVPVSEDDHIRGPEDAEVTIVEYSDFQCPYCGRFHPTMKQVMENYPNQVRWVYKHFPLDSIHPNARPAAEASECVAAQAGDEGFWQFADAMFENQSRLGRDFYVEVAGQIDGVNVSEFESCIDSREYQDEVESDYQEGISLGVRGTPGSFINGTEIPGAVPYSYMQTAIEQVLSGE